MLAGSADGAPDIDLSEDMATAVQSDDQLDDEDGNLSGAQARNTRTISWNSHSSRVIAPLSHALSVP